jgi:hypothetical protein
MKHTKSDKWFKYFLIIGSIYFAVHIIHAIASGAI